MHSRTSPSAIRELSEGPDQNAQASKLIRELAHSLGGLIGRRLANHRDDRERPRSNLRIVEKWEPRDGQSGGGPSESETTK